MRFFSYMPLNPQLSTKIAIKGQILPSIEGVYYIEDEYIRLFSDHALGFHNKLSRYQHSEIFRMLTMVYFCEGEYLEDITKLGMVFSTAGFPRYSVTIR